MTAKVHEGPRKVPGCRTTYQVTGKKQIVFERRYDAPPEQVFATFTDLARVDEWWNSPGTTLEVEAMDVRPGGKWCFVETSANGGKTTFHGEYKEIEEPDRIVMTLCYGRGRASKMFAVEETYEFLTDGDQTHLRVTSDYPMGMALNGMLSVGMDDPGGKMDGSRHQWRLERLAEVVDA